MQNIAGKFEELDLEEQTLLQRIGTCENCVSAILEYISKSTETVHFLTVEDIVSAIHVIGTDLQTELLHVRLEKTNLMQQIVQSSDLTGEAGTRYDHL